MEGVLEGHERVPVTVRRWLGTIGTILWPFLGVIMIDVPQPGSCVLDAVRKSDGEMVMLKQVSRTVHPNEISIGQYLCSAALASDPRNHCCPVLDVLQDPTNPDIDILVMPLFREYNDPPHITVGEAIDFFRQAFEVQTVP